ncbi:hypothetical protein FA531_23440, partial [Pseudomonas aeruginosa]|nr:hypothetical protein [Pseudomonas aeruginosa]
MLASARRALHPGHPPAIHRAMNSEIDPGRCPLCQQSNRCTLADPASPHFSQPCALGRFDGRRSSQVAQAADSADFGQAPASALEQG